MKKAEFYLCVRPGKAAKVCGYVSGNMGVLWSPYFNCWRVTDIDTGRHVCEGTTRKGALKLGARVMNSDGGKELAVRAKDSEVYKSFKASIAEQEGK